MFSEPGNTPYRQIAPSKKASSAGWIAKRKASNTDDANKPYPFSFMRIYNCKCPAPAPRDTVHVHTPFARHKDARTSSAAAPPPLQGIKKDRTHPAFFLFDTIPHQVRLFLFGLRILIIPLDTDMGCSGPESLLQILYGFHFPPFFPVLL